jgi:hypothetical protein
MLVFRLFNNEAYPRKLFEILNLTLDPVIGTQYSLDFFILPMTPRYFLYCPVRPKAPIKGKPLKDKRPPIRFNLNLKIKTNGNRQFFLNFLIPILIRGFF